MSLFRAGAFALNSGQLASWKIECDALTAEDWQALALMAVERLPPFGVVVGVPRGGVPFAAALRAHVTPGCDTLLVAEDVVTTGGSIERFLAATEVGSYRRVIGVAAFARGKCPAWVTPLFRLAEPFSEVT